MRGRRDDLTGVAEKERIADEEKCVGSHLRQACQCRFEVMVIAGGQGVDLHAEPVRRFLHIGKFRGAGGIVRIAECGENVGMRQQLVQEPQALLPNLDEQTGDAGDVAAGVVVIGDQPDLDRIRGGQEHNRDARRGRLNRQVAALIHAGHGDDIDRSPHQIGGQCRNAIVSTFRPPVLDCHVSTLGEALFVQAAAKRG
jgi:hypothetical protein